MTSTDAKELINLAERMGIPTEDVVHRVIVRIVDEATRAVPQYATRSSPEIRRPATSPR
jgi:hypothetical protein